jgi:hypothetical protein
VDGRDIGRGDEGAMGMRNLFHPDTCSEFPKLGPHALKVKNPVINPETLEFRVAKGG